MNQMNPMMQMFGQMVCMPMNIFAETLSRAMQGMQSMPMSCGQPAAALCPPAPSPCATTCTAIDVPCASDCRVDCCREPGHEHRGWQKDGDVCCSRDYHHSTGDRVVLYEYTLVDVGRSYGRVLENGQKLVDSCTSSEQLHNMVIVEYLERHPDHHVQGKNLRVFCRQLDSWCKAPWDYEERQIDVLEGIRRAIEHGKHG